MGSKPVGLGHSFFQDRLMSKLRLTIRKSDGKTIVSKRGKSGNFKLSKQGDKTVVEPDAGAAFAKMDVSRRAQVLKSKKVRAVRKGS